MTDHNRSVHPGKWNFIVKFLKWNSSKQQSWCLLRSLACKRWNDLQERIEVHGHQILPMSRLRPQLKTAPENVTQTYQMCLVRIVFNKVIQDISIAALSFPNTWTPQCQAILGILEISYKMEVSWAHISLHLSKKLKDILFRIYLCGYLLTRISWASSIYF